jgi:hypothetical protein
MNLRGGESAYWRTTIRAAHALAPVESYARTTIVFVPCSSGIPEATHVPVPAAVPDAPASVCQVILVTPPVPPDAWPVTVMLVEPTLVTIAAGLVTCMEIGDRVAFVVDGGCTDIVAVCEAEACEASKAVTVMLFVPVTRGIPLAVQTPFTTLAEPLND